MLCIYVLRDKDRIVHTQHYERFSSLSPRPSIKTEILCVVDVNKIVDGVCFFCFSVFILGFAFCCVVFVALGSFAVVCALVYM